MNGNGGLSRRRTEGAQRPTKPANPAATPKRHGEHPSYKTRRWAQ